MRSPVAAPSRFADLPLFFPLRRAARTRFEIESESLVPFAVAETTAAKLNAVKSDASTLGPGAPEAKGGWVSAGMLRGAALCDEIAAFLIAVYSVQIAPTSFDRAPRFLDQNLGAPETARLLERFEAEFEAGPVPSEPDRILTLTRVLRVQLLNFNPALTAASPLFDDSELFETAYPRVWGVLHAFFSSFPAWSPRPDAPALTLLDLLMEPVRRHPDSIEAQLRFWLEEWGDVLAPLRERLLIGLDVLGEESKPGLSGPGPALVPSYEGEVGLDEFEAFSLDRDWMPRVVLLAKQTYVWLDQLSRKYGRAIERFDQIPDEELDEMAARGFTGLWLIGIWQRSRASRRIKHMTGNPDALASAYSLESYDVAWELGGDEAIANLQKRARARGIRLACDMVPNHMAIDSRWMIEHPDWFLSLPYPPFSHANFDTPDLCDDHRVEVRLERGYYDRSDASVVFERRDALSGEVRYIYHGNDGTAIPWNDTAQLDYLNARVREEVKAVIVDVARRFPIIRFDAAMTLAKRHVRRLWFPAPGEGGAIPSRAGRGLSAGEFEAALPREFWREVVDLVAREAPDTLLLAEAFWMMEGFFVRTLGMHRVYNSAFMNMLRDELNASYRQTIKNTLEFDPEVLGRFVNFMNNPDEDTAEAQFGKGDKYFGVATLLATLPGLPMWGHGQIEGLTEKYGMEYPRAYRDESPDLGFVAHHERVLFPLLRRRALFAGSAHFALYDFWRDGHVDENVFAFSNRHGDERALVFYNNSAGATAGWVRASVAFARKQSDGSKLLSSTTLGQALGFGAAPDLFLIFRESNGGLEFLRRANEVEERGLFVTLNPYGAQVFLDWRAELDQSGDLARLHDSLDGAGVPSIERARRALRLMHIIEPWRALLQAEPWRDFSRGDDQEVRSRLLTFEAALPPEQEGFGRRVLEWLEANYLAPNAPDLGPQPAINGASGDDQAQLGALLAEVEREADAVLVVYALCRALGPQAASLLDEWLLDGQAKQFLAEAGAPPERFEELCLWLEHARSEPATAFELLRALLDDPAARAWLGVNTFERTIYFRGEGLERVLDALTLGAALEGIDLPTAEIEGAAKNANFRVVAWMEALHSVNDRANVGS